MMQYSRLTSLGEVAFFLNPVKQFSSFHARGGEGIDVSGCVEEGEGKGLKEETL